MLGLAYTCRRCTNVNTLLVEPDTANRKGLNTLLHKMIVNKRYEVQGNRLNRG
jgi:hypothetical protein